MKEYSKGEYDKLFKKEKDLKVRKFKDPKGHTLEFSIDGSFESIVLYCDKCYIGYLLTKEEVDLL